MKLGGCAVGDLNPDVLGPEIAVVSEAGDVFVLTRRGGRWDADRIAKLPGEMIQCAIGDADASRDGDELAVVGMAEGTEESGGKGAVQLFWHTADGYGHEQVFEDSALVHGVCCDRGDLYIAGFSRQGMRFVHTDDGWQHEVIAELPGAGKAAVTTQFGVAFACTDGSVVLSRLIDRKWDAAVVDKRDAGRARLGTDGARVLVADDDGTLSLIGRDGSDLVYKTAQKLRGAVLAELDPRGEGLEAATAGYDHQVVLVRRIGGTWEPRVIYVDDGRLHSLAAGDLDPAPGLEPRDLRLLGQARDAPPRRLIGGRSHRVWTSAAQKATSRVPAASRAGTASSSSSCQWFASGSPIRNR